jgi:site-specific DNA recombinase
MTKDPVRCAIYTRKSSEEGLEQSFNSLAAQREACQAFIASQKHEGWTALKDAYDDGGISGGTMDRPALQRLLKDIQERRINTVVVYKVDRLTRSLTDFAKIVEIFDSHAVSFVSVTQQFNTTTSMGRLTLNVLLSFAQFEREVTGERIRDKIAASKRKGMWMGGMVPLGYDCVKRELVVNRAESETVRRIFRAYLSSGCLTQLKKNLEQCGIRSKIRISAAGRQYGGVSYSRGALHHLLSNRIYLGEIVHGKQYFRGQHEAIVSRQLWNQVADRLEQSNKACREVGGEFTSSLLTGLLFDSNGIRFTPTHCCKNGRRYRYYTSQAVIQSIGTRPKIARIPAHAIERLVLAQLHCLLRAPDSFLRQIQDGVERDAIAGSVDKLAKDWPSLSLSTTRNFIRRTVSRIVIAQSNARIEIDANRLSEFLLPRSGGEARPGSPRLLSVSLNASFQLFRRGTEVFLTQPTADRRASEPVSSIIKAIARSRDWYERVIAGEFCSIEQIAKHSGLTKRYVRKILQCAYLSPSVTQGILEGRHAPNLTLRAVLAVTSADWRVQEQEFLLGRQIDSRWGLFANDTRKTASSYSRMDDRKHSADCEGCRR